MTAGRRLGRQIKWQSRPMANSFEAPGEFFMKLENTVKSFTYYKMAIRYLNNIEFKLIISGNKLSSTRKNLETVASNMVVIKMQLFLQLAPY